MMSTHVYKHICILILKWMFNKALLTEYTEKVLKYLFDIFQWNDFED